MIHFLKMAGGYAALWAILIVTTPFVFIGIIVGKALDKLTRPKS